MENVSIVDMGVVLTIFISISMMAFMYCMRSFDRKLRMRFILMVVALLIAALAFVADDYLNYYSEIQNLRYITKIVKDAAEGFIELQAVLILEDCKSVRRIVAYCFPFVVTTLILATAPINPNVFYFTEDHQYVRGNLAYLIYAEGLVYAAEMLWICIKKWREGHQRDAIIVVVMIAEIVVGVFLEERHIFHSGIISTAALGVLFLYMYIYALRYNVDSVSHCLKRRCFYSDAARYGGHTMAVVSMDLNDLKLINDNYGHKAGDVALLTFANTVKSVMSKKFILYRTGGDEFMLLGLRTTKDEAKELIGNIRAALEPTGYTCSFGVAMYRAGDDFDEIVVKADKAMYADKKAYKKDNKRKHSRKNEAFTLIEKEAE